MPTTSQELFRSPPPQHFLCMKKTSSVHTDFRFLFTRSYNWPADHKIALRARLNTCLGTKNAGEQDGTEGQRGNRATGTQSLRCDNEFYQTVDLGRAERDDLADDSSTAGMKI